VRLHDYKHNFTLEKDLCGDSCPRLSVERSSIFFAFSSAAAGKPRSSTLHQVYRCPHLLRKLGYVPGIAKPTFDGWGKKPDILVDSHARR
jgi:hypothetical protein